MNGFSKSIFLYLYKHKLYIIIISVVLNISLLSIKIYLNYTLSELWFELMTLSISSLLVYLFHFYDSLISMYFLKIFESRLMVNYYFPQQVSYWFENLHAPKNNVSQVVWRENRTRSGHCWRSIYSAGYNNAYTYHNMNTYTLTPHHYRHLPEYLIPYPWADRRWINNTPPGCTIQDIIDYIDIDLVLLKIKTHNWNSFRSDAALILFKTADDAARRIGLTDNQRLTIFFVNYLNLPAREQINLQNTPEFIHEISSINNPNFIHRIVEMN